jgi:translation initiation factor IF-1
LATEDLVQLEGVITDIRGGGHYIVKVNPSGQEVLTKLCGKMKRFNIRVIVGDRVTVGVSPYDVTRGLILFRHNG